jgi:hypothetical protein
MRRVAVAIAAGLLALMVCGLALGASKGLKERSVAFSAADGLGEGTAPCKAGEEAVAGGFSGPSGSLVPFVSAREGERFWRTRVYSGLGGADEVIGYVYCDKKEPGLKVKRATEVSPDVVLPDSVTARCGRGKEAVSGGFEFEDSELVVTSSKRAGKRSWEIGYIAVPETTVTAFALCDKSEPGLKTKQGSMTPPVGGPASAIAKCKRKQQLRSGGFEAEYNYPTGEDQSLVHESSKPGKRRWEVAGSAIDGEPEMVAYAYCDKKEKK